MTDFNDPNQFIRLENPVSHHYETFIVGNALAWECMAFETLLRDAPEIARALGEPKEFLGGFKPGDKRHDRWWRFRDAVQEHVTDLHVAQQESAKGQVLVLCGAGPSLRDHAEQWVPQGDQVWGCNSALTWLADNDYPVTHAVTVDQTPHMLLEWERRPDVEYLCASTIHPHLTEHLLNSERRVTWFNNYVGINKPPVAWEGETMPYEDWLYSLLFPPTIRCGSGLNTLTRAIDLALFMGFERIIVLGADCALRVKKKAKKGVIFGTPAHVQWLREDVEMHADGGSAVASEATATTLEGKIDGRKWTTKPDMMITAVWLVKWRRRLGRKKLTLIGDTLPNALQDKTDEYLERLPALIDKQGNTLKLI